MYRVWSKNPSVNAFSELGSIGEGGTHIWFGSDRGVQLEPQNPYTSLKIISAEKGTLDFFFFFFFCVCVCKKQGPYLRISGKKATH